MTTLIEKSTDDTAKVSVAASEPDLNWSVFPLAPTCLPEPHSSLVSIDSKNTMPPELGYYFDSKTNTYMVLESKLEKYAVCTPQTYIDLDNNGLINRIELLDFPAEGQYTLCINGHNCATAKYDT